MPSKAEQLAERIRKTMENAEDWEKVKTQIPGIFMVKAPDKSLRVMVVFNPPDEAGNPTKKKGLFFSTMDWVEAARVAFGNKDLDKLVEAIQKVNGPAGRKTVDEGEVFHI
jgi:hypothetical protein